MLRFRLLPCLLLAACGGGGGNAGTTTVGSDSSLAAAPVTIPANAAQGELTISLADTGATAPVLLEAHVRLPAGLRLAANDRLTAATALVTLDGDFVGDEFVVLCGDADNTNALPLPTGPLFRLRIEPEQPRARGTYPVVLRGLRGASSDGDAVTIEPATMTVSVTVD